MTRSCLSILLLGMTCYLHADSYKGPVREVQDGDTLILDTGAGELRVIRLHGVDCPEGSQAYTKEARDFVVARCLDQEVNVHGRSVDRASRLVATVVLADGSDLALALVESGYAWCYPAHGPIPEVFQAAEVIARQERRGLWQDLQPVAPWLWRSPRAPRAGPTSVVTLVGEITQVTDGDSLTLKTEDGTEHSLRLYGIDAPEGGRPFSEAASAFVAKAALASVIVQVIGPLDRYGRKVGRVICADGQDLGLALVTAGLAWWQPRMAPDDALLRDAEKEARQARRGLWEDDNPKPPWEK